MSINKDSWKNPTKADISSIIKTGVTNEPYEFNQYEIDGVRIYTKQLDFSPCIHARIGFKFGAVHDEPGREGTAHFLEHMLFDGSDMFLDEKETQDFSKTIMLDTLNAYTGLFELFVTGKSLPHNFETALAGIFSIITNPKLTEKSWQHEQKVITQEAWGRLLNEKRIAYLKKEKENMFYDLPDRVRSASVLGWPETIIAITHEDLVKTHKKYFVKENMEIYLAGNLFGACKDEQDLKNLLHSFIQKIPNGEKSKEPYVPASIGAPRVNTFEHTYEEVGLSTRQQTSISIDSAKPRLGNRENEKSHIAALSVASELLSELAFRRLRLENSWCYGAHASSHVSPDYIGFNVSSSVDEAHTDEAISIIWGIVSDFEKGQFKEDFEKTKYLVIENTVARERTTSGIVDVAVEGIKNNNEILLLKDFLLYISKVTYEDIQNIISTYLDKNIVFTEIIKPGKSA